MKDVIDPVAEDFQHLMILVGVNLQVAGQSLAQGDVPAAAQAIGCAGKVFRMIIAGWHDDDLDPEAIEGQEPVGETLLAAGETVPAIAGDEEAAAGLMEEGVVSGPETAEDIDPIDQGEAAKPEDEEAEVPVAG